MDTIPQLVAEGFNLHLKIEALKEKLHQIESRLKQEALLRTGEHIPLKSKVSQGSQWVVASEHCEVRIVLPDQRLKESIPWEGRDVERIRSVCADHFEKLFEPAWYFIPTHHFRQKASELLGVDASRLIKLCTRAASPKILWREK